MVRNAGDETVPNIAVTVAGLDYRATQPGLANPERPQFAINAVPREIGGFPEAKDATPDGCDTAYVNTWACGPLKPGAQRTFEWKVTAVKAGPYKITLARGRGAERQGQGGGLGRRRRADRDASPARVSNAAPDVRIAADGKTVVTETP